MHAHCSLQTNKLIHRSFSYCLQKYMFVNKCRVSMYIFILLGNCVLIQKATYCHMVGCFLLFIDLQAAIILVLLGYPLLRIFLFQYYIGSTECRKNTQTPKTHFSQREAETIKPSNQHHFYILLWIGCGVLSYRLLFCIL